MGLKVWFNKDQNYYNNDKPVIKYTYFRYMATTVI